MRQREIDFNVMLQEVLMPKFVMQIETPHPILFLQDGSPTVECPEPETTGLAPVMSTASCICFPVLPSVDGASVVTVTDEECDLPGIKVFDDGISVSTGLLTVRDTHLFDYLRIPVNDGLLPVTITVDEEQNPSWVWIRLGEIRND